MRLLAIYIFLFGTALMATVQQPDLIRIRGTVGQMASEPLERYFEQFPKKQPRSTIISSNLWKGYHARFEVIDERLFLKEIRVREDRTFLFLRSEWKTVTKDVFPKRSDRFLSWFTGFIFLEDPKVEAAWPKLAPRLLFFRNGKLQADHKFSVAEFSEYAQSVFLALDASSEYKHWRAGHDGYTGDVTREAFHFLYFFDERLPSHLLRNYKDFRPNQSLQPTAPSGRGSP